MNRIINTALLIEQLKRFWGLSALIFTYYAITLPLPIYMSSPYGHGYLDLASLINMENRFMIFSVVFAPLAAVIILFKCQNQAKSATAMHSYPLTRNQLLITKASAGMILLMLPLLAYCVIMIFSIHQLYYELFFLPRSAFVPIVPVYPQLSVLTNSIIVVSRFFLITALSFLFYLSLYMIAAMVSGNTIITLLLCVALPLFPARLHTLAIDICRFYVFGFVQRANMDNYLAYMRPILLSELWERDGYTLFPIVLYTAIAIAMIACSVFISNKRAQEQIGDSIVFPYIKNTLVFILSAYGLLLTGYIFFNMFRTTSFMYIGAAIGFFIAYCIAQMIAEKKFNILNKMRDFTKFGAVAIGILLLIIASTRSDIFGYERYVPRFTDIEGVQMQDVGILARALGKSPNVALNELLLIKDTEIINETLALHQAIVNERLSLRQFHTERRQLNAIRRGSRFRGTDVNYHFSVLYKLKNGNLIVRSYYLPESFIDENNVQELRARSSLSMSLLQNRPYLIDGIQLTFYDLDHSGIVISKQDHIQEFINAFKKDDDLIQPIIRFTSDGILVRFRSEALGAYTWMNSLSFEIVYSERSYVRDWFIENGYF